MGRGMFPYRFEVSLAANDCGSCPVLVRGETTLEYFTEPADPDSGYPSRTYDVWLGDEFDVTSVTCADCDRVIVTPPEDLAALRTRAAKALMHDHSADLQHAAKEDFEG